MISNNSLPCTFSTAGQSRRPSRGSRLSPESAQDSPRPSDIAMQPPKLGRGRRSRRPPAQPPAEEDPPETTNPTPTGRKSTRRSRHLTPGAIPGDQDCLFNHLKRDSAPLSAMAGRWLESYAENNLQALAKLLELFLHASGCPILITSEMFEEVEATTEKIHQALTDDPKDFPLMRKTPAWLKFTSNLIEFIRQLFLQCQNSIIYDGMLVESLRVYLVDLSNSQLRSLRYTSTLVLLKISTHLQELDLAVKDTREINQRQLQTEVDKPAEERSLSRIESLTEKGHELQENRVVLNKLTDDLYRSLFVPRVSDILVEIRHLCLEELATWLDLRPIKHLASLEFIGHGLSDKSPDIRWQSVKILQSVYSSELLRSRLQGFNDTYKKRIVVLPLDKDNRVAVEAVKLMSILFKNWREILNEADYETVYLLVISKHRELAQVSGHCVMTMCLNDVDDAGGTMTTNESVLKDLVKFFVELARPEHAAWVVDALIDNHPVIQDWESMMNLLENAEEQGLNEEQLVALVKLMVASVEESATGEMPLGRAPQKRILLAREQRKIAHDREKLTQHFIINLPLLLVKYRTSYPILSNLLRIPQYFYLDMYVQTRQEKKLLDLLDEMRKIVERTSDTDTLRALSKSLEYLCSEKHAKSSQCQTQRDVILDDIVQRYREAIATYDNLIAGNEVPDDDENLQIVESLKKIAMFISCHNINQYKLYKSFVKIVRSFKDPSNIFPEEGIVHILQICYYTLIWWRNTLNYPELLGDREETAVRNVRNYVARFLNDMRDFVANERFNSSIRQEAYKIVCDLLVTFNKSLDKDPNQLLHSIVYEPDDNWHQILNAFIQKYVFIDENSNVDEFYSRRNLLMAFCKLVICNVFTVKSAVHVVKHYDAFYNDYGDIIKMTLGKAKDMNKTNWALTMQLSLNVLFDEAMTRGGGSIDVDGLQGMINLAKRFALSLGIDTSKIKEQVTAIHVAGINFVAAKPDGEEVYGVDVPHKLPYLVVLREFSSKLSKDGKEEMLKVGFAWCFFRFRNF